MRVSVCSDVGNGKNCIRTASGECSGVYRNSVVESSKGTQNSSKGHRFKLPGFSFLTKIFPSIKNKKRSQNSLDKFRDGTEKRQKCSFRVMLINCIYCFLIKMTVILLASTALASDSPNQEMQTHSLSEVEYNPGYVKSFFNAITGTWYAGKDFVYAAAKDNMDFVYATAKGNRELVCAAAKGNIEKIEQLLENQYINVNKKINVDKNGLPHDLGVTALMLAARGGHEKCVELLLNKSADVNLQDDHGRTALMFAMHQRKKGTYIETVDININIVKCLLQRSYLDSEMSWKALHEAAKYGNAECINLLLNDKRFDVNAKDENGCTALMHAVYGIKKIEVIKALLDHGADTKLTDNDGETALLNAVKLQNSNCISALTRDDDDIEFLMDLSKKLIPTDDATQRDKDLIIKRNVFLLLFLVDRGVCKFSHDGENITFQDKNGKIDMSFSMAAIE